MSFEWRTDEDDGWQEEARAEDTAVTSFWRRRWPFFVVVLFGGAIVWASVQWQISQRVTIATEDISAEILRTHNFVLQTAVDRDEALFKANLSGRNPEWGDVQKTLLNEGLMLDRPMLGWQHEASLPALTLDEVIFDLAPDLRAAELSYPQTYVVQLPSGVTETVTLQQTAVYRQGNTRWLYSPPYADFWGGWVTQREDYLTLAYPERDKEVAARLAVDLAALLNQMCTELPALNCDSDLRVNLRLDTNPDSLLVVNEVETIVEAGLRLEMPAPTLLGVPVDEAGYGVLLRAYEVQVATAVLAHQAAYDCCRHELFFQALRDYQLAQLDLQAWPLEEAMFGQMLSAGFDGNTLSSWTRRFAEATPQSLQVWVVEDPDPIWQQVYMLIAFLNEQETAVSPLEMMRLLERNSYHGWLEDSLADGYDQDLFPSLFLEYIYGQSLDGQQAEPPIPFPDGEITVVCNDYEYGVNTAVYAYDLSTRAWQEKLPNLEINTLANNYLSTSDGKHFILTENDFRGQVLTSRFYLVTEEDKVFLEETEMRPDGEPEHYIGYSIASRADSRFGQDKIIRYESVQGNFEVTLRSFACPTEGCPQVWSRSFPIFSPNGEYFIEEVPMEAIGDVSQSGASLPPEFSVVSATEGYKRGIGRGWNGFWLNDEKYGLVRISENGWELAVASLSNPELLTLFKESELLAQVTDILPGFSVSDVFLIPNTHDLILQGSASGESPGLNRLFRLQLADDLASVTKAEPLWPGPFEGGVAGYSPDGRYIVLARYNVASSSSGGTNFYLLERENLQVSEPIRLYTSGYGLSWSPDGQWFLQNTENYMLLQAPDYDYQYYIPHSFGECQQTALSVDE